MKVPSGMPQSATMSREQVENFLYYEADLLDAWNLPEWLELFEAGARYHVPATDNPDGDQAMDLALIDDDYEALKGRVQRLMSTWAHIENPRSITSRLISNVRVWDLPDDLIGVRANALVSRSRVKTPTTYYMAECRYQLRPVGGSFLIRHKETVLRHETLRDVGGVLSIVM